MCFFIIQIEENAFVRDSDTYLTPTIPDDCPPLLREIMEKCWHKDPQQRPVSFLTRYLMILCLMYLSFFSLFCI
jgi:hypothetical protein